MFTKEELLVIEDALNILSLWKKVEIIKISLWHITESKKNYG